MTVPALERLNRIYMRVIRKIAGKSRYDDSVVETDREIRDMVGAVSIDCHIIRLRLKYLARLCAKGPESLTAILQAKYKDKEMPWVTKAEKDMVTLYGVVRPGPLPDPELPGRAQSWFDFMRTQRVVFDCIVDSMHFSESVSYTRHNKGHKHIIICFSPSSVWRL